MLNGLSGSLLSHDALARMVPAILREALDEGGCEAARRRIRTWHLSVRTKVGPASSARAVFDQIGAPLALHLGFRITRLDRSGDIVHAVLETKWGPAVVLLVTPWGQDAVSAWRDAVRWGIGQGVRWCFCATGPTLRLFDADRAYARRFAEFELASALDDETTFAAFWGLLRADAFTRDPSESMLDRAVVLCDRHRRDVRASLQHGVVQALTHLVAAFSAAARQRAGSQPLDEALIVVYRVLFLLFAEARGLVPRWHPVYRESYTIEALRPVVERLPRPRGLWETLQAIARLAHRGCHAGTLRVTAFNGRLFAPSYAPLADSVPLDDSVVRQALLALTTRRGRDGVERIAYADLGPEQLGGVYERLLDVDSPASPATSPAILLPAGRRKATGTFYTPRSLTEYLVRRTLAPLTESASPDAILSLRVVDLAMGSGAFLVAACRYLATSYEQALVREGSLTAADIGDDDRAGFRRTVAQRCLFGVDINPMAVQLGRLSLWLATLAGDRPLTFLDHHLRAGNSLIGASVVDMVRQPPGGSNQRRARALPLFPAEALTPAMEWAVRPRLAITLEPGDTLEQVRSKERVLADLARPGSPLASWKMAADLWCAGWFGDRSRTDAPATFGALVDAVVSRAGPLPAHVAAPLLDNAVAIAGRERFFHWTLEFPEVFHGPDGLPLADTGFDAVIGNPPWEMLHSDHAGRAATADVARFTRNSGVYALQGAGHVNLYQLFAERGLSLLKTRGGRLGVVLPSGFATDHGCAALRRHVLDRTRIDTFVTLENRDAIFPIHRGLKFLLVTLTNGSATATVPSRTGVRDPVILDRLPDSGIDSQCVPLRRPLLERLSGAQLVIPDIRTALDLKITSQIAFTIPAFGDRAGWYVHFGRELNATEDRPYFTANARGLAVIEGKQLQPFIANVAAAAQHIPARSAARLLDPQKTYMRPRLGYREVAAATNRLTLIAAVIPAGVVTTHTIFCLKETLDGATHHFLCGILNSFVANYLVRMRVSTHVTAAIIDRLPVPRPDTNAPAFTELVFLSRRLAHGLDAAAAARAQAVAAKLYGLDADSFGHVVDSFPLVAEAERAAALSAFRYIV